MNECHLLHSASHKIAQSLPTVFSFDILAHFHHQYHHCHPVAVL